MNDSTWNMPSSATSVSHCMDHVPYVTCILFHCTKIMVSFSLLAERPHCWVILPVRHIQAGDFEVRNNITHALEPGSDNYSYKILSQHNWFNLGMPSSATSISDPYIVMTFLSMCTYFAKIYFSM